MDNMTLKVIELISQNKSINEISNTLNLTNQQIYNLITHARNDGYFFRRKYYDSGEIVYVDKNDETIDKNTSTKNDTNIITNPNTTSLHAIIISDLHVGNEKQNLSAIYEIFNYCAKNNIHLIFNAGDLIDGMFGDENKIHKNMFEQIDYLLKMYPFDKSILTFTILGNHDMAPLNSTDLDLANILKSFRHDIVPVGYGEGFINIKNDLLILRHELHKSNKKPNSMTGNNIVIKGHSHRMKVINSGSCIVHAPSLSNLTFTENEFAPMAIEMHIEFDAGYIKKATFEQLLILDNKIYKINSYDYHFNQKAGRRKEKIKLVEDSPYTLKLTKKESE